MNHLDGKKVMLQISKQTGSGYFEASKKKPVGEIHAEIEEELRNQYSIGYTLDRPASEGRFQKMLTMKRKGLVVQAREGYYPGERKLAS